MNTFFIIALVVLCGLVVISLIRGIVAFLKTTKIDLETGNAETVTAMQEMQNKQMFNRIKYQALAIVVVAIIIMINRVGRGAMVKLNKIYTRTGDDGTTGLVDGTRRAKHSARIDAIGEVDEANSAIGMAASVMTDVHQKGALFRVQNDMFDLGADLATPLDEASGDGFEPSEMVLRMVPAQTQWLEDIIDRLNEQLEPLTSFVLPGGSAAAAHVHLARAIARRAERAVTALAAGRGGEPRRAHLRQSPVRLSVRTCSRGEPRRAGRRQMGAGRKQVGVRFEREVGFAQRAQGKRGAERYSVRGEAAIELSIAVCIRTVEVETPTAK